MMKNKSLWIIIVVVVILSTLVIAGVRNVNFTDESINILIVGDSIGWGTGASSSESKWFRILTEYMHSEQGLNLNIDNISLGGNSSYAGYCTIMNNDAYKEYDYIIVCYGENDLEDDFDLYYEILLRAAISKYPDSRIITVLESSQKDYTAKIQIIQALSSYYDTYVADTIAGFDDSGYKYDELTDDGCHPNDLGQEIYFEVIRGAIEAAIADEADTVNSNITNDADIINEEAHIYNIDEYKPLNARVSEFDEYVYSNVSQCKKTGDLEYVFSFEPKCGNVGIDYDTVKGDGSITATLSNGESIKKVISWNSDYVQEFIELIGTAQSDFDTITFSFSSKEQMDSFRGVIVSN